MGLAFLFAGSASVSAAGHKLELTGGYLDIVDIRYGYESRYIGLAVSPGLGVLALNESNAGLGIPFRWNPSLSVYKSFRMNDWFALNPAVVASYQMGWTGANAMEGPDNASWRVDRIYLEERLGLEASYREVYLEFSPGILPYYEFLAVQKNVHRYGSGSDDRWRWDGLGFSIALGKRF
jgi:hypothetical protein